MPTPSRPSRSFPVSLTLLCCLLMTSAFAQDTAWPVLNVGLSDVPNLDGQVAGEGGAATLTPSDRTTFAAMRKGGFGSVQTSFDRHAHIMLFRFAPDGGVLAARTISFHMAYNGNAAVWYWALPMASVEHAVTLLQTDAALATGPAINLTVHNWAKTDGDSAAPTLNATDLSVGDSTASIGGVDSATLMRVFEPMVVAASAECGYRISPTADQPVKVELRALHEATDIRVTSGDRVLEMRHVPHTETYESLRRMFLALRAGPAVIGVARVSNNAPSGLAATEKVLLLRSGYNLQSLDINTGRLYWPITTNPERPETVQALPFQRPDGQTVVVGTQPVFGILDPVSGKATAGFAGAAPSAGAICLDQTGRVAFARGATVEVYDDGAQIWQRKLAADVVAGPRETGAGLVVLTADRQLVLLAADGTPRTLAEVSPGLGQLISAGQGMVCLVGQREVYAQVVAGGATIDTTFSDVVKSAEPLTSDSLLVWTGDNRLRIVQAGAKSPTAEREWDSWIRGVNVVADGNRRFIAVSDITGHLHLLNPSTLETIASMNMGMDLAGAPEPLLLPVPWPPGPTGRTGTPVATDDEVSDEALMTAIIVSASPRRVLALRDRTGFIFLIAPEKL